MRQQSWVLNVARSVSFRGCYKPPNANDLYCPSYEEVVSDSCNINMFRFSSAWVALWAMNVSFYFTEGLQTELDCGGQFASRRKTRCLPCRENATDIRGEGRICRTPPLATGFEFPCALLYPLSASKRLDIAPFSVGPQVRPKFGQTISTI